MAQSSKILKPRSVFVICEAGSNIRPLINIFNDLGLSTLNIEDIIAEGASLFDGTRRLIERADIVCALLTDRDSNNVYYEIGYARGIGRPLVLIGEPAWIPEDLSDQFWIKSSPNDYNAISFQMQVFLANFEFSRSSRSERSRSLPPRESPTEKLKGRGVPQSLIEQSILNVLLTSPEVESIAPQPRDKSRSPYIPDFAVWLSTSSTTIGSPVIIEVKAGDLGLSAIEQIVSRMRRFAEAGDIPTGLIVVAESHRRELRVVNLNPLIFLLSLDELQKLTNAGMLTETLRKERNRFAHSAG